MRSPLFILALGTILPAIRATPLPANGIAPGTPNNLTMGISAAPRDICGPWGNYPKMSTWLTFEDMFNKNKDSMRNNGDTDQDIGRIWNAIVESAKIGVDERVIFGIIMQESHGYVGAPTTRSPEGLETRGIMQCIGCPGFPGRNNLSQDQINSMVRAGTQHYKDDLKTEGDCWAEKCIYNALRRYNSGSINPDDLCDGRGATNSYVSDVSQRFTGWVN